MMGGNKKNFIECPPSLKRDVFKETAMYTIEGLKKHFGVLPIIALQLGAIGGLLYVIYHRTFVTTIDVQMGSQRWEMEPKNGFFDLRNPRSLKFVDRKWEPAIGLDNRYRLMRGEKMLDADGNETTDFGDDNTEIESFEELQKKYGTYETNL